MPLQSMADHCTQHLPHVLRNTINRYHLAVVVLLNWIPKLPLDQMVQNSLLRLIEKVVQPKINLSLYRQKYLRPQIIRRTLNKT